MRWPTNAPATPEPRARYTAGDSLLPDRPLTIPALDGLRGMAAIAVLLFHVLYWAGRPELGNGIGRDLMVSGYVGVDFFFVISGFLLFLPAVRKQGRFGDLRAYATRRAARILPAYYVALLATLLLMPLLTKAVIDLPQNSGSGLANFLLHLLLLQHSAGLALGLPEGFVVNAVFWTLSLEVLFYLFLPLVAARYLRHPWLWLMAFAGISLGWQYWAVHLPMSVNPALPNAPTVAGMGVLTQFPAYLGHFGAGMTAAFVFHRVSSSTSYERRRWIAIPVQVLALALIGWEMHRSAVADLAGTAGAYDHWPASEGIVLGFTALLLSTALAPDWAQFLFTNPLSRKLGEVSYGIYLWHLPLIAFAVTTLGFDRDATSGAFFRLFALVVPGSILLGWLSWSLVEKPAISWARRRSKRTVEAPVLADLGVILVGKLPEPEGAGGG